MIRLLATFAALVLMPVVCFTQEPDSKADAQNTPSNANIDFAGFLALTQKLMPEREKRRVPLERFLEMANEADTIILDSRSKWAFDAVHMKGAIHLNFSDFNDAKLREIIRSKTTRVLIYCNNNFLTTNAVEKRDILDPNTNRRNELDDDEEIIAGTTVKQPPLALNIPTFINLWGYGYKNIYELADIVETDDPRIKLEGTGVQPSDRIGRTKP